jgi:hypothetical protein
LAHCFSFGKSVLSVQEGEYCRFVTIGRRIAVLYLSARQFPFLVAWKVHQTLYDAGRTPVPPDL